MTTAPMPLSHSLLFWGLHYGTRHFPTMVTLSSWNTWTWKNFSQRMASLPVQPSTTTALINQLFSNLPQPRHLSWTSATEHPHRSTRLWFPKTACKIQPGQVKLRGPLTFRHRGWGVPYMCHTEPFPFRWWICVEYWRETWFSAGNGRLDTLLALPGSRPYLIQDESFDWRSPSVECCQNSLSVFLLVLPAHTCSEQLQYHNVWKQLIIYRLKWNC